MENESQLESISEDKREVHLGDLLIDETYARSKEFSSFPITKITEGSFWAEKHKTTIVTNHENSIVLLKNGDYYVGERTRPLFETYSDKFARIKEGIFRK